MNSQNISCVIPAISYKYLTSLKRIMQLYNKLFDAIDLINSTFSFSVGLIVNFSLHDFFLLNFNIPDHLFIRILSSEQRTRILLNTREDSYWFSIWIIFVYHNWWPLFIDPDSNSFNIDSNCHKLWKESECTSY
jgi:hypothetical protein